MPSKYQQFLIGGQEIHNPLLAGVRLQIIGALEQSGNSSGSFELRCLACLLCLLPICLHLAFIHRARNRGDDFRRQEGHHFRLRAAERSCRKQRVKFRRIGDAFIFCPIRGFLRIAIAVCIRIKIREGLWINAVKDRPQLNGAASSRRPGHCKQARDLRGEAHKRPRSLGGAVADCLDFIADQCLKALGVEVMLKR